MKPVLDDRKKVERMAKTFDGFVSVLLDETKYGRLKQCAVEEFSTENPMFWDTYQHLMAKPRSIMGKQEERLDRYLPRLDEIKRAYHQRYTSA